MICIVLQKLLRAQISGGQGPCGEMVVFCYQAKASNQPEGVNCRLQGCRLKKLKINKTKNNTKN